MMGFSLKVLRVVFSQTAKDSYWIFSANIFASFLAFLYTIFLARSFSPSIFGIFSSVLTFMLLVSDIADMGIGSSLSRFLPPYYARGEINKASSFLKTVFLFQLKIALVSSIIILVLSPNLSKYLLLSTTYTWLYLVSAVGIFGIIILAFATFTLSAQRKFREVATLSTLSTAFKLILVIILYQMKRLDLFWTTVAFAASSFIAYYISFIFLPLNFLKEKEEKGNLKKLLSFSSFMALSRIFSATAGRLDVLMLVPLASAFEAGIYAASFKIIYIYILLSSSFSMVIAPRLSSFFSYQEAWQYLKKVIVAVAGILSTMIVMYLIAPRFVVFVLGQDYFLSVSVFQALLLPMAFFTLTIPAVNFLIYVAKKPQISTFNTLLQLLIIFAGNLVFIPRYVRFGPVITLTIAYAFTFLSSSFFAVYFYKKGKNG